MSSSIPPRSVANRGDAARRDLSVAYLQRRLELLSDHMAAVAQASTDDVVTDAVRGYLAAADDARPVAQTLDDDALPSLERVRRRFALSDLDEHVLLLALAPLVDARFGELVAAIKRNIGRTTPDIGLALVLFSERFGDRIAHRAAFGPDAPLIAHNLLALDHRAARDGSNLLDVGLRLPARMQALLLETEASDPQLEGFSRLLWPTTALDQVILPPRSVTEVMNLVGRFDAYLARRDAWGYQAVGDGQNGVLLLFDGPPGTGKTMLAHAIARTLGRPLLLIDAHQLQGQRGLDASLDAIMREARLQRAVLFFDDCETLFGNRLSGNRDLTLLLAAIDAYDGIILLATNLPTLLDPALDRRVTLRVEFEVPPPRLRERIWRLHLPAATPLADDVDLPFLSEKYEFAGGYIRNSVVVALNLALARGDDDPRVTMQDFDDAARSQVRHRLKQLATRGHTHLTLDDVILPDDVKERLHAIIAAVRNRRIIFDEWGFGEKLTTGKGLCALFRGDSGTGKTLSAEILGNELAMPLYRVRIPSIVSKYIGETEKNLEKCFREAALAGALLLFDEADSIFSKRVEVSSSNDRYSNMEVNLLLQEIERFEGVVMLTTNLDAAIDDAFDRRLNFKIDFPFPDEDARRLIWRKLIPAQAPLADDVNFKFLGEDFELSGGSIKNAVLRAAYQAAEVRTQMTMELLERSAEQEYRELGKLVPTRRDPWD